MCVCAIVISHNRYYVCERVGGMVIRVAKDTRFVYLEKDENTECNRHIQIETCLHLNKHGSSFDITARRALRAYAMASGRHRP